MSVESSSDATPSHPSRAPSKSPLASRPGCRRVRVRVLLQSKASEGALQSCRRPRWRTSTGGGARPGDSVPAGRPRRSAGGRAAARGGCRGPRASLILAWSGSSGQRVGEMPVPAVDSEVGRRPGCGRAGRRAAEEPDAPCHVTKLAWLRTALGSGQVTGSLLGRSPEPRGH
jgi:hypothetical protein